MLTDIIVHMDRGAGCTARLMAAINLALRHGARLKGLYVITHSPYTSNSDYLSDYAQVREFFINAASKAGVEAEWLLVDWTIVGTPLSEIVTRYAYYTDTILIGQPTGTRIRRPNLAFHEQLILSTGRPIVVFPANGDLFQFGNRVLIAWKGGREAVRAVHDAMPFLQLATDVAIAAVVANRTEQAQEEHSMTELKQLLERSGIKARTEAVPITKGTVADTLLAHADREQSDLIVFGGFAYKSNRAPFLSPLAEELLVKTPVPLLVSH